MCPNPLRQNLLGGSILPAKPLPWVPAGPPPFLATGKRLFSGIYGIPRVDSTTPGNRLPRAILNFTARDDNAMGIAVDANYAYLATEHNNLDKGGAFGDSRIYIGQYLQVVDDKGIPPTASITSPAPGTSFIVGTPIKVQVTATDDVRVAAVNFLVNGSIAFTATARPYEFTFTAPQTLGTLTLGANAVDLGGNIGTAQDVQVIVIPDPGTTVTGRVIDVNQLPVPGAAVNVDAQHATTTSIDGTFSIPNVPTVNGNIVVHASAVVNGINLVGSSAGFPPVPAGATNRGDIVLRVGGKLIVAPHDPGPVPLLKTNPLSPDSTLNIGLELIALAGGPHGNRAGGLS